MGKFALVLGGAGFIGSHLLKYLVESGEYDSVVCGDIAEPRFHVKGATYKHADVRERLPENLAPGVTEIFNLAAVHTTPGHEDWEYYWTNVLGATHCCDFARRVGCNTILFTSSISVYGPGEDEKDELTAVNPISSYGKSKFCAEEISRQWRQESDQRRLVIVRPAVIYGYGERGNFTRLGQLLSKGRFVYPGRKDTIKSNGYVKDLVASFRYMIDRCDGELLYNFCHLDRITTEKICSTFHDVADYHVPKVVFPLPLMLAGSYAFEVLAKLGLKTSINRARIYKLYHSTNIAPKSLMAHGYSYRYDFPESLRDWRSMSANQGFD